MIAFLRDIRRAMRVLLKNRVSTLVAVFALAVGVGVNASMFISVNSIILHPMPYRNLDRIMTVWSAPRSASGERDLMASGDFSDLQRQGRSFEKLAGFEERDVALTGIGQPEEILGCRVTNNFFPVFGMHPLMGRTFNEAAGADEESGTAVVSEAFWRGHMAAAPDAVGKSIQISGAKYTVIGVMPDVFDYPLSTEVWLPLRIGPSEQHERTIRRLGAVGLLKPGSTIAQAKTETSAVAARLAQQFPQVDGERSLVLAPLKMLTDGTTNNFLLTLLAAAGFVLLLACANVGNLQLAKAAGRQKEITVRAALGASRVQIARELFAESLLIALAGGVLGLALAMWNNSLMQSTISPEALRAVPGLRHLQVDATVILFTVAASLLGGLLCSAPAIIQLAARRTSGSLADALRERAQSAASSVANRRIQSALVIFELAAALVLLVGAGLMANTFSNLMHRYQGFDPKNVLTMRISLPETQYNGAQIAPFLSRALDSLKSGGQVQAASLSSLKGTVAKLAIEGRPEPRPDEPRPDLISVSSRYLDTMRIPLYEGRFVKESDGIDTARVVVVSYSVAHHYWPNENAIGRHIQLDGDRDWLTVVGVTGDVIDNWFTGEHSLTAYVPYTQTPGRSVRFELRTQGDPRVAAGPARTVIHQLDKGLPVFQMKTMEREMAEQRGGIQAAASMMTRCATVALLLAITGLYAVLSFAVTARTHEIGVRMAVGASGSDVLKMTMRQTAGLVALGLAVGLPLAILLAKVMAAALYGVVTLSWTTFVTFPALLVAAAAFATYLPSRRASLIDPVIALREE